jgi:hypothetical protein
MRVESLSQTFGEFLDELVVSGALLQFLQYLVPVFPGKRPGLSGASIK